jgi:DnaJ-class molecular chaperone
MSSRDECEELRNGGLRHDCNANSEPLNSSGDRSESNSESGADQRKLSPDLACGLCEGEGKVWHLGTARMPVTCPKCNGDQDFVGRTTEKICVQCNESGCTHCNWWGRITVNRPCRKCSGSGAIMRMVASSIQVDCSCLS